MSHSVIYNKIFGSDIFNRQAQSFVPKTTQRQSSVRDSSDIFNTSDIPEIKIKPVRQSLLIDKSDIFNTKPKPEKPKKIRNHSQSDIFFVEGKVQPSYDVYHPRAQYQSNYNPEKHIKLNDSYKMKMKDMYGIDPNKSDKNIISSKGFCDYMDFKDSKEQNQRTIKNYAARTEAKEFYKIKVDEMEHNRTKQPTANPRDQYMSDHLSNVFHDKDIENKNKNIKPSDVLKEPKNTYHLTKPKNITNKNKWIANLKWHHPQNEIIFKNYNNNYNTEKQSAHERKLIDLAGVDNNNNNNNNSKHKNQIQSNKIIKNENDNEYTKPIIPSDFNTTCQRAKLTQDASHFNNERFYEDNFKLKALPDSAIKDRTFTVSNANNLDKKNLMKLFNSNGIHIYNIQENKGNILSENDNNIKSYSFTVRDNTSGTNSNFEKATKQLKDTYKNAQIALKHKICVNKKITSITHNDKKVHKNNNNSVSMNNNSNNSKLSHKTEKNHDINSSFSKQYNNINHSYKNLNSERANRK